jgi:hypothetical protein
MKCPACGWEILGKCANPDCKKGSKKARPKFKPPLKTQRGHGAGARVRTVQAVGDMTLEDVSEQGDRRDYVDSFERWYAKLPPEERLSVDAEIETLRRKFGRPSQRKPFENR